MSTKLVYSSIEDFLEYGTGPGDTGRYKFE